MTHLRIDRRGKEWELVVSAERGEEEHGMRSLGVAF